MNQFITLSDLAGIIPEIILTLTALCVLSLDMMRVSRPRLGLFITIIGLLTAGIVITQSMCDVRLLFGGMLKINQFSKFFDLIYLTIALATLLSSQGYMEKKALNYHSEYPS